MRLSGESRQSSRKKRTAPMPGKTTRERIVEAADQLFYRNGFEHTSFSEIATAVHISRGNFYHHFKTKDDILDAVIELRMSDTGKMLDGWDAEADDPAGRIERFMRILVTNRAAIMLHGCPVGTLNAELAKLDHRARPEAGKLFALFRQWLRRQFAALGHAARADELAMRTLAWSQGVAALANAFRDEDYVNREVARMCAWLRAGATDDHTSMEERLECS